MVEFGLISILSVVLALVTLQASLVIAQSVSAAHVARRTARWLAVNIDATDAEVAARAATEAAGLPGLGGGGLAGATVSPVARQCAARVSGKCPNRESGDAITVTIRVNVSTVMFLPTTYGQPPLQFQFPTTMPDIAYTVMFE